MFEVDLCIRIRGYHQLNFHQLVHDRPNDLCDWLRMGQMASAKLFLWVGFYFLVKKEDWFKIAKRCNPARQNAKVHPDYGFSLIIWIPKMAIFAQNYLSWSIW